MKNPLPKSVWIPALCGLALLVAGDLYNSFGFLVCVLGCLCLLTGWLCGLRHFSKVKSEKTRKITKIVKIITFTVLSLFVLSFLWVEGLILAHDGGTPEPSARTIIVLGAKVDGDVPSLTLRTRLETALAYLEDAPSAVVIVTGGQGRGETRTEASVMADWLSSRGIAKDRILLEDKSTDTRENLRNALAIADAQSLPAPFGVVSSSFHLYRAEKLALEAGFEAVQTLSAPVPRVPLGWLTASVYLREYCSIILMALRAIL